MYRTGDYVMKANTGLCRIVDISHPEGMGIDRDKIFYRMVPLEDEKANIYVPVDNESLTIRKAMSEEEAWKVIREIPQTEAVQIENDKQREQEYKKAIASGSPRALVSIIKTMYVRKQKRFAQGKKQQRWMNAISRWRRSICTLSWHLLSERIKARCSG